MLGFTTKYNFVILNTKNRVLKEIAQERFSSFASKTLRKHLMTEEFGHCHRKHFAGNPQFVRLEALLSIFAQRVD